MSNEKIKVLIAKPGLDGHESGAKLIARALMEAGMEVIYTGTRQTPEMIVNSALQEDVDLMGLSILSGAHLEVCGRIMALMSQKKIDDIPVILGGIIPAADAKQLEAAGIKAVFGPGTHTADVIACVKTLVANRKTGS